MLWSWNSQSISTFTNLPFVADATLIPRPSCNSALLRASSKANRSNLLPSHGETWLGFVIFHYGPRVALLVPVAIKCTIIAPPSPVQYFRWATHSTRDPSWPLRLHCLGDWGGIALKLNFWMLTATSNRGNYQRIMSQLLVLWRIKTCCFNTTANKQSRWWRNVPQRLLQSIDYWWMKGARAFMLGIGDLLLCLS